ncbi:MAG: hypothetical protein Q4F29_12075, partial [Lachnospiraceae bacterium]|nr:hypothetical protein [Lachnospiraceae bacterium]
MAVVRCSKGHYYDDTKFAQCPHCGVLPDAKEGKPAKQKRFGFFHKDDSGKKSKQAGAQNMEELNEGLTEAASEDLYNPDRTIGLSEMIGGEGNRTEAFPHMAAGADNNQTVSFPHMGAGGDDGRTIAYPHPSRQPVNEDDNRTIAYPHPSRQPVNEDEN